MMDPIQLETEQKIEKAERLMKSSQQFLALEIFTKVTWMSKSTGAYQQSFYPNASQTEC